MKIAVPVLEPTFCSAVADTFARCRHFAVIDSDTRETVFVENTAADRSGGAATAAVQLLVDAGVKALLTRQCGPKASAALTAAKIEVRLDQHGTIAEVVEAFIATLPR